DVAAPDFRALVWFGNERPYLHSCDRFARVLAAASPFVPIFFHLIVTDERLLDQFDVSEPLDRRDRIPTWHDEPQRETMMDRQRLAIHDISKNRTGVVRLVKPETAFIADRARRTFDRAAVCASEQNLARQGFDSGAIKNRLERYAGPFGGADCAESPLFARNRWIKFGAAITGAFECREKRLRRHLHQIPKAETELPPYQTTDCKPIVGGVEMRNLEMITYIEAGVRHDYAAHQRRQGRFGVERVGTMNNKPSVDSVLGYLFRIKRRAKAMGEQHSQRPIEPQAQAMIRSEVLLERVAGDAQHRHRGDGAQRGRCRLRFEQRHLADDLSLADVRNGGVAALHRHAQFPIEH